RVSLLVSPIRHLLVVGSIGLFAWQLDTTLTLLVLVCVPLMSIAAWLFGPRLKHAERAKREASASLNAFTHQVLGAIPLVQSFGTASRNAAVFSGLSQRMVRATEKSAVLTHVFALASGAATTLGAALVIYVGGERVLARELPLGTLLVFLAYVRTLDSALRALLRTYGALRGAEASVDRVLEIADARDRIEERHGARALPPRQPHGSGGVVFERVTFGYEPERPVLKAVSLVVDPGQTVALVGRTGAGKTTLASLVPRFFDPWEGRVLLDGVDLKDLNTASLRAEIALVLQEPFILPMSVLDNIAYGRPDAPRDDIVAAAVAANAHEFIRALPQGYDTIVGERGATLSGGQQQRLAIARALLKDPRVLVLDEPTSALDGQTEDLVMSALERLMARRTTLIIAHRLATVRRADRIAVMDEGRVVETGTHVELLATGGRYAQLYSMAAFGALPEHSQ
ncbi:MAG TPA: ABC transporter ATP-binding protein, partial [Burkholderiales bacterium]|nr:ABC transporter ATP-binding protein [Burkholderiales bacterium]